MQIIPFKEIAAWQAQINLTGSIFLLYFRWNALNKYWVMNINDGNDTAILLGVKVVNNYDLTSQFSAIPGMPLGDIVCQSIIDFWYDISRYDMGRNTDLIYYEPGELQAQAEAEAQSQKEIQMEENE
jgi:hypothetical protein